MKEQICKMRSTWPATEQTCVHHVREPCQWMPVCQPGCLKSPLYTGPRQSRLHVRIGRKIIRIVESGEIEIHCRPKNAECYRNQQKANDDRFLERLRPTPRACETDRRGRAFC